MANNCNTPEFIQGGTHVDTTIVNPSVTGGNITNTTITASTLAGGVSLDAITAKNIADQICGDTKVCVDGYIDDKVEIQTPANVAAVFSDCAGVPYQVGTATVPSCTEFTAGIADAKAHADTAVTNLEMAVDLEITRLDDRIDDEADRVDAAMLAEKTRLDAEMLAEKNRVDAEMLAEKNRVDTAFTDLVTNIAATVASLDFDKILSVSLNAQGDAVIETMRNSDTTPVLHVIPLPNAYVVTDMKVTNNVLTVEQMDKMGNTSSMSTPLPVATNVKSFDFDFAEEEFVLDTVRTDGVDQKWTLPLEALPVIIATPTDMELSELTKGEELPTDIVGYDADRPSLQAGCNGYIFLKQFNVYIPYYNKV